MCNRKNIGFNNIINNPIEQPLLIKIEGKSNEMQNKKLLERNDSITNFALENYDSNKNILVKEKLKANNFLKSNKNSDEKNKILFNNKKDAINKIEETNGNDFIY